MHDDVLSRWNQQHPEAASVSRKHFAMLLPKLIYSMNINNLLKLMKFMHIFVSLLGDRDAERRR